MDKIRPSLKNFNLAWIFLFRIKRKIFENKYFLESSIFWLLEIRQD